MTMKHWTLTALTLAAGCATAPEVKATRAPEVSAQELSLADQELNDFTVRLEGQVSSPEAATLEKATYELVLDEKPVKTGEEALNVQVPAGGSAPFVLTVKTPYAQGDAAKEGAPSGAALAALRGKLVLSVGGRKVELDYAKSREVKLPQAPSVVMNEIDFARFAANEAGGTFYVGVKNPNAFPLHLAGLTYAATINGKPVGDGELGRGEEVAPASTGVFEVQLQVNAETYGPDVDKLIKTQVLPYELKGELAARRFKTAYALKGDIKLNVSK